MISGQEPKSEVLRLLCQIDAELEAAQRGLSGFALTAKHDFINMRLERVWDHQEELAAHVGEAEATQMMVERYIDVIG